MMQKASNFYQTIVPSGYLTGQKLINFGWLALEILSKTSRDFYVGHPVISKIAEGVYWLYLYWQYKYFNTIFVLVLVLAIQFKILYWYWDTKVLYWCFYQYFWNFLRTEKLHLVRCSAQFPTFFALVRFSPVWEFSA